MLVLSRKPGEAIVLAGNITIRVLGIEHDRVKIGVDAPPDVLVLRSELVAGYEPVDAPAVPAVPAPIHPASREQDAPPHRPIRPLRPLRPLR